MFACLLLLSGPSLHGPLQQLWRDLYDCLQSPHDLAQAGSSAAVRLWEGVVVAGGSCLQSFTCRLTRACVSCALGTQPHHPAVR